MKKFIQRVILSLSLVAGLSLAVVPAAVGAQSKEDICQGIGLTSGTGGNDCETPPGSPSVDDTIADVINILSIIVGVVAVIMVIVGGLKYILSSGDSNQVNSAKNTILFALVGLVIVALAQVIVIFVLDEVTS